MGPDEGFPLGKSYRGAAAVVEGVFKSNDGRWENFSFYIEQYLDPGDSVIVLGAYVGRNRQSQKLLRAAAAHVYDLVGCRYQNDLGVDGLIQRCSSSGFDDVRDLVVYQSLR